MGQGFDARLRLKTSTSLRVDPRVIVASQVMQLNVAELDQAVESELHENPALERIDDGSTEPTNSEILSVIAPQELRPAGENREMTRSLPSEGSADVDWMDFAPANASLADHLTAQLAGVVPLALWRVAEYLVGSLNERGYLAVSLEDVALDSGCSLEEAEAVLRMLQGCEPLGVGARDIRECLTIQLRRSCSDAERLARDVVTKDWALVVKKDSRRVASKYRVSPELAEDALCIVTSLNPFPAEGFDTSARTTSRSNHVTPDLVLAITEQGWYVEAPGSDASNLRVTRFYAQRRRDLRAGSRADAHERRHVDQYVERAEAFLGAVASRRNTLRSIGNYLIEHQAGFVRTGDLRFLQPLTRSQVALALGTHESTISRATHRKFVQIATGEVLAFETLFKPALRIQQAIADILATENPDHPLSDEAIARLLASQGIKIARRTVNKYRDQTRLLSSRRRRSA